MLPVSVRSGMVGFVPRQGRTKVSTAGVAKEELRRGQKAAENAVSGQKMPFKSGHLLATEAPEVKNFVLDKMERL